MAVAYVQDENVGGVRRYFNQLGNKVARPKGVTVNNVGAVLVIGEPIRMASLPDDECEARAVLVAAIENCSNKANAIAAQQLKQRKAKQQRA